MEREREGERHGRHIIDILDRLDRLVDTLYGSILMKFLDMDDSDDSPGAVELRGASCRAVGCGGASTSGLWILGRCLAGAQNGSDKG